MVGDEFKVGDVVRLKSWDCLKEEYGINANEEIATTFPVPHGMKSFLDTCDEFTISSIVQDTTKPGVFWVKGYDNDEFEVDFEIIEHLDDDDISEEISFLEGFK